MNEIATRHSDMQAVFQLADCFAKAAGSPAAAAALKILAGRQLGLPDIVSLTGIHYYDGKFTFASHLIAGAIRSSGRYDFEVLEHDDSVCAVRFLRRHEGETWKALGIERLTLQEAQQKGWTQSRKGGDMSTWTKTPKNMLFARCLTNGHKFFCPDLFGGLPVYAEGELGEDDLQQPQQQPIDAVVVQSPSQPEIPPQNGTQQPQTVIQEVAPANPTPPQQDEVLTADEYQMVVGSIRSKGLMLAHVKLLCSILGVPVLDRAPRSRLQWLLMVIAEGLAPTPVVDRITALVTALALPWDGIQRRLQKAYGVSSLAHLTPTQAASVEQTLAQTAAARSQLQPAG